MLESLPAVAARRDDLVAFGVAVARQLVTRARPLFPKYDLEWPVALEAVALHRLRERLGIDASEWLNG